MYFRLWNNSNNSTFVMNSAFYHWYGYNELIFHVINNAKDSWLDVFMQLGTVLGNYLYMPLYAAILLFFAMYKSVQHGKEQRWSAVAIWMVTLTTFVGAFLLDAAFLVYVKQLFNLPRPPAALGTDAVKLLGHLEDYHHSFPSGHASFAMTIVASLWLSLASHQRIAGVLFVIWVGVSRVYVGAHFPADVVAGWLSALVIALVVRRTALAIVPRIVVWWAGMLARRARLR
jgi:membrane-associated phospholipid phosphatase